MASMNKDKQLGEQQSLEEKPKIEDSQEPAENAEIKDANLAKSAEEMDKELETSTTMVDLPPSGPHRKLPAELNQQIFYCLNLPTRRKFICGLGWDFYAMFRHKLLTKTKRVCNPHGNRWNRTNTTATVAADGRSVSSQFGSSNVFAVQPFPISGLHFRVDEFPGTILYYYEIKGNNMWWTYDGLSDGAIDDHDNLFIGQYSNSYAILTNDSCWLAGERHQLDLPEGAIEPRWKSNGINVFGCGLVLDPEDKVWIFFTLNGQLKARKIAISPTVDRLFPTVQMSAETAFEANFGDDPAKSFEYDLRNCPGLGLRCI